jgi:tetratricopeptide (TPR) repeat protein
MRWFKPLEALMQKISETDAEVAAYEKAGPISTQPSLAFMNLGKQQAAQGDLEKALRNLEQAAEIEPMNADVFANWGITLAKARRLEEALGKFARASELQPDRAIHYVLWGACLVELDREEEAKICYENAIALKPRHVEPWLNWAIALSRRGKFMEALPKVERVLELNATHPQGFFLWGTILAEMGKLPQAAEKLRLCLKYEPHHIEAHYALTHVLYRQKRFEEALALCETTAVLAPEKAEVYQVWGDSHHARGDYPQAQACFDQALELNPQRAETWLSMARLQYDCQRPEQALELFARVEQLNPQHPGLHSLWALTLLETGQPEPALRTLQRHATTPEDANGFLAYTIAHARLNQWNDAEHFLQQGLAKFPQEASLHQAQGNIYAHRLRFADAYLSFRQAAQLRRHFTQAEMNTGLMLLQTGAREEALSYARVLFRQHGDASFPHTCLYSLTLLANGHILDAQEKLAHCLDAFPQETRGLSAQLMALLLDPAQQMAPIEVFLDAIDQATAPPLEALGPHWLYVYARACFRLEKPEAAEQAWRLLQQSQPGLSHLQLEHAVTVEPWRFWLYGM